MNTNTATSGPAFFPKAGRIAREESNDIRIEVDGRGIFYLKADDRAKLLWNGQANIYGYDGEFHTFAGTARKTKSGKAVMFLVGYNIYMTPISLIRRLFQGTMDKCILSLFLNAEPVRSDIRAGLATGFD
jgi:hypothetical protein